MAYNVEKLAKLKSLKQLAEKVAQDFAPKSQLDALSARVDGIGSVGGGGSGGISSVKVNGAAQTVTDGAVDIAVPVNVSDLNNDSKFQTEAQVAAAVAAADHLKRKIVANKDAIDLTAPDAAQYIYMVQKGSAESGDKYDEYMVIDGAVERVGDWTVDLDGYVQKETGKGLSTNDYTDGEMARLAAIADTMHTAPTSTQFRATTPAYSGTGPILEQTIETLLGSEGLASLTASGTDSEGGSLYDIEINGAVVGQYTKDATLSQVVEGINASEEAGVRVSYSENDSKFIFTAKKFGAGGNVEIGTGLAGALFDAVSDLAFGSKKFVEPYGITWLKDGESERVEFAIDGYGEVKLDITKDTTIQNVVDRLNGSLFNGSYMFSCSKYTGQIEMKSKSSGALAELKIKDSWGDPVNFDSSDAPASPYTYGKDGVFTAIEVNGVVQSVWDKTVNIVVPTKVSQLTNDGGFIKAEDIATDDEIAEMLNEVFAAVEEAAGEVVSEEGTADGMESEDLPGEDRADETDASSAEEGSAG